MPQQVSVLGFDDSPLAGLAHVDLSTVRQDAMGLATAAVQRLAGRLDAPDGLADTVDVVREPTLVVRSSTGAPGGAACGNGSSK